MSIGFLYHATPHSRWTPPDWRELSVSVVDGHEHRDGHVLTAEGGVGEVEHAGDLDGLLVALPTVIWVHPVRFSNIITDTCLIFFSASVTSKNYAFR